MFISLTNCISSLVNLPGQADISPLTLTFAVVSIDELSNVDYDQVYETQASVLKSNDNSKFIISWSGKPTFIRDGSIVPLQTLNYNQHNVLIATAEWS